MHRQFVAVDGFRAAPGAAMDLRDDLWGYALDQRAFGPRRLIVVFADASYQMTGLAYTDRIDPPEAAMGPCIQHVGQGATFAVAYCDEPVLDGPPPPDTAARFASAAAIAAEYDIELLDWIACDDQTFRSFRIALYPDDDRWSRPGQ